MTIEVELKTKDYSQKPTRWVAVFYEPIGDDDMTKLADIVEKLKDMVSCANHMSRHRSLAFKMR